MTEREALTLLMAMGYTMAMSGGRTYMLSDLLSSVDEGAEAVIDFWPSHINFWRVSTNGENQIKQTPPLVIQKKISS